MPNKQVEIVELILPGSSGWTNQMTIYWRRRGPPAGIYQAVIGCIHWGAGLVCQLNPPPPAVCPCSGGEEGRCLRAVASGKVEGGERASWWPASSTRAASRWKQVRLLPLISICQCVNQSSDRFMSLSRASLRIPAPASPLHPSSYGQ